MIKGTYNAYVRISNVNGEADIIRALKKLDDQLKAENFKYELEKRRYFIPPGERRRLKSKAARARKRYKALETQE